MAGRTKGKVEAADPRDVLVKVLRKHSNLHDAPFVKEKGKFYVHPQPAADIAGGLVELVRESDVKGSDAEASIPKKVPAKK